MDAKNGTLIGGIGGAALVAMLLAGPGKMTSTQPVNTTALAGLPTETVGSSSILRASLDQGGPWSALCEEFVTGINDPAANSVVTPGASPKGAEPGASEATVKSGSVESRVPVHSFPAKVDLSQCVPKDDLETFNTLIAMVPDPVRSHMQMEFDRTVAGIVRGAGAADFALQRYWFPWTPSSQQNSQKISEDQRQLRLRQPGVLIFRHTEIAEDERLAIFLVSEAPTAGVNRVQFSHALEYVRQLQGNKPPKIKIAGPRFSASLPILEELIKSFTAKTFPSGVTSYANFSVYSPSASNDVLMDRFVRKLPGVDFLTFQIRDEEMLCSLVATLKGMSYRPEEIATLSEDESAYGVGQEPEADEAQSGDNGRPTTKCTTTQNLLRLQFPRDLSSIRNAIDEQNPAQETARQLGIPLASVPLSLHEQPQNDHDSPPPYATQQAAADLDRELQSMIGRLRENNVQAVVLMASNPLDRLFLLDYLHRSLPDVRLATAESDALMLHRPGYVDLSGTIVLTGAPLVPDARAARWRNKSIAVSESMAAEFRSTGEEAAFLSVWSLVAPPVTDVALPEPYPGSILSSDCEFTSLVASDRFLLASSKLIKPLFPCTTMRRNVAGITQHLESTPRLWIGFLMLVFLVSSWHIALMVVNVFAADVDECVRRGWLGSVGERVKQSLRWDLYRVAHSAANDGGFAAEKLLLLFVLTNQILLFAYMAFRTTYVNWAPLDEFDSLFGTGLIAWFARHGGDFIAGPGFTAWLTRHSDPNCLVSALVFVCTLGLAGVSVVTLMKLWIKIGADPKSGLLWQSLVGTVFVISTVGTWEYLLRAGGDSPNWGMAYRSMQLLAGLSPLAAIGAVLCGYTAWTITHLRRLEFVQTRRVHLDFQLDGQNDSATVSADHATTIERELHESIENPVRRPAWAVLIFLVPVLVLLRVNVALRGIDVSAGIFRFSPFSLTVWSIVWGFLALIVFIAFSIYKNWSMWKNLRALLHYLNFTAIRDVFSDIAADTSSMQIWKIGSNRRSLLLQYRTLEALRRMESAEAAASSAQEKARGAAAGAEGGSSTSIVSATRTDPRAGKTTLTTTAITASPGTTTTVTTVQTTTDDKEKSAAPRQIHSDKRLNRLAEIIYVSERSGRAQCGLAKCGTVAELSQLLNLRLGESKSLLVQFDRAEASPVDSLKARYLALRFAALIRYAMAQIRNMLWLCLWGYVFLLLSVRLYPFQGRHTLSMLMTLMFLALLLAIGGMFSQMESDPILGRLEDAKNVGQSSFLGVAGKLVSVGGVPLLAVLASQFPAFAELISGWIKPISDALH